MRDYKKFFTPDKEARRMAIIFDPPVPDWEVLEPSAGDGQLVRAMRKYHYHTRITAIERDPEYAKELRGSGAKRVECIDFLKWKTEKKFDGCISNPPFGNDTDLNHHFYKTISHVRLGGRILIILPEDFLVPGHHSVFKIDNWAKNKDGSVSPTKLVRFNVTVWVSQLATDVLAIIHGVQRRGEPVDKFLISHFVRNRIEVQRRILETKNP